MYVVSIRNKVTKKEEGPVLFTGSDTEYKSVKDGIDAAQQWIDSQDNKGDFEVKYRIVGCL